MTEQIQHSQNITQSQSPVANQPEPKMPTVILALSVLISLIRIVISFRTYLSMKSGNGPWAEGRAFGYLTGHINNPILILLFILNLVATFKVATAKFNRSLARTAFIWLVFVWILWLIIAIFTVLIFTV